VYIIVALQVKKIKFQFLKIFGLEDIFADKIKQPTEVPNKWCNPKFVSWQGIHHTMFICQGCIKFFIPNCTGRGGGAQWFIWGAEGPVAIFFLYIQKLSEQTGI